MSSRSEWSDGNTRVCHGDNRLSKRSRAAPHGIAGGLYPLHEFRVVSLKAEAVPYPMQLNIASPVIR